MSGCLDGAPRGLRSVAATSQLSAYLERSGLPHDGQPFWFLLWQRTSERKVSGRGRRIQNASDGGPGRCGRGRWLSLWILWRSSLASGLLTGRTSEVWSATQGQAGWKPRPLGWGTQSAGLTGDTQAPVGDMSGLEHHLRDWGKRRLVGGIQRPRTPDERHFRSLANGVQARLWIGDLNPAGVY